MKVTTFTNYPSVYLTWRWNERCRRINNSDTLKYQDKEIDKESNKLHELKHDVSSCRSAAERNLTHVIHLKWQNHTREQFNKLFVYEIWNFCFSLFDHNKNNPDWYYWGTKMLKNLPAGKFRELLVHSGLWAGPQLPAWCCVQVSAED